MTHKNLHNRLRVSKFRLKSHFVFDKMLASYGNFKAKIYKRKCTIPFERMFTRISIETRTDCNLKCIFCPQSTILRSNLVMQDELFKKIIDELSDMNFTGRICPLVNNEPLLDNRIVNFISYTRQKCPLCFLELITNGRLLTKKYLLGLFAAGLDSLIINDYRNDREKHPFKLSANLTEIVELTNNMFKSKVSISLRSTSEKLSSRAGNINTKTKPIIHQFCALPFTGMWIQPEGKSIICCQDYRYEEIMGDLRKNSLLEIWFNNKYQHIRKELYAQNRTNKICEKCDYSGAPL